MTYKELCAYLVLIGKEKLVEDMNKTLPDIKYKEYYINETVWKHIWYYNLSNNAYRIPLEDFYIHYED